MTSLNISITKEAYEYLKDFKGKDKSFSEVILDFKKRDNSENNSKTLLKFSGVLKHVNWENREKNMKDFRDELEERFSRKI